MINCFRKGKGRNMGKRFGIAAAAGMLISILCCRNVWAADIYEIEAERYQAQEGLLTLYVGQSGGMDQELPEQVRVTAGGIPLSVKSVERLGETGRGINYLCLVDVSGTIKDAGLEEIKQVLLGLSDRLKEQDQICIATVSDAVSFSGWLRAEDLPEAAGKLERTRKDTNLYAGIVDSIKYLQEQDDGSVQSCLVVFSDGEDDFRTGITREEALKAVEEANIPTFTVSILQSKPRKGEDEISKQFGSFARMNPEGVAMVPILEELSGEDMADIIVNAVDSILVIQADLSGYQGSGQIWLEVETVLAGGSRGVSGLYLPGSKLEEGMLPEQKEPSEEQTEEQTEETASSETEPEEGLQDQEGTEDQETVPFDLMKIAALAGAAAVALILILILVLWNRKKKAKSPGSADPLETQPVPETTSDQAVTEAQPQQEPVQEQAQESAQKLQPVRPAEAVIVLKMIEMGRQGTVNRRTPYQITVGKEFRIGREATKSDLAISDDPTLSACHCILSYSNGRLTIRDNHSVNGTYLNGIRINRTEMVNLGDRILIGNREYRIYQ